MTDKTVLDEPKRKICILPIAIDGHHEFDHHAILIGWGFKFLCPFEMNEKMQYVEMPEGWEFQTIVPDQHFKVVDEKGRCRINAFIDIDGLFDPFMRLCNRYTILFDGNQMTEENLYVAKVYDCETFLIYQTDPVVGYEDESDDYKVRVAIRSACIWLGQNKPGWTNPANHWED